MEMAQSKDIYEENEDEEEIGEDMNEEEDEEEEESELGEKHFFEDAFVLDTPMEESLNSKQNKKGTTLRQ